MSWSNLNSLSCFVRVFCLDRPSTSLRSVAGPCEWPPASNRVQKTTGIGEIEQRLFVEHLMIITSPENRNRKMCTHFWSPDFLGNHGGTCSSCAGIHQHGICMAGRTTCTCSGKTPMVQNVHVGLNWRTDRMDNGHYEQTGSIRQGESMWSLEKSSDDSQIVLHLFPLNFLSFSFQGHGNWVSKRVQVEVK